MQGIINKVYYKHNAFNIYAVKSEFLKVIDNIHENPELLGDKNNELHTR